MAFAPRRTLLLLAFGLASNLAAGEPPAASKVGEKKLETKKESGFAQVRALALPDNPATLWPDIQFVQADKQGRVFLLRGDTLDLFALSPGGRLLARGQLEGAETRADSGAWVDAVALSAAGDTWVTLTGLERLEVFRGGKSALRLKSKWLVSSVAADDGPVVGVLPGELDLVAGEAARLAVPPMVQRWDGKRWETLVDGEVPSDRRSGFGLGYLRGQYGNLIALAPNGQLWVADRNAYRLRRFTASGLPKDELRIGKGGVEWSERTEEDFARLEKISKENGYPFDRKRVSPTVAAPHYRGMVVGRDGRVYLIAETSHGLALDRFDPSYPSYDRVLLGGVVPSEGPMTFAAGAHALVLAPRMAKDGLWEIPEEALQEADWREVPDASVNGTPIPPREPEKAPAQAGVAPGQS